MSRFEEALTIKLEQSRTNAFGKSNYDEHRFGRFDASLQGIHNNFKRFGKYAEGLGRLYDNLQPIDQALLVQLVAYRLMGFDKVKLPRNSPEYWEAIAFSKSLLDESDTYDPQYLDQVLYRAELQKAGYTVSLYDDTVAIAKMFIIEQYAYKQNGYAVVAAQPGDVVLDLGACWGDTALYFADKTGPDGKVYSFEFIPNNIKLFSTNLALNPHLADRVVLVPYPATEHSGETIYFQDNGPGSRIQFKSIDRPADGVTIENQSTVSIAVDDFVKQENLSRVDMIKIDIEGSEWSALKGALETIKKFRPKLAIGIYHSMDEFVTIPNWIMDLQLGYKLYLDHYTIHSEETVCFAIAD